MNDTSPGQTLHQHLEDFRDRRLIAMPIAGMVMWLAIGLAGATGGPLQQVWALYIGTGSIFYLGLVVARYTGEDLLNRTAKNPFDKLFLSTVIMALLVFAIAIPFARVDHTSLPLTVGILTGLMWVPMSWILDHWIGIAHSVGRTAMVLGAWIAVPNHRFVVVPAAIVLVYAVTIVVLENRWRERLPS